MRIKENPVGQRGKKVNLNRKNLSSNRARINSKLGKGLSNALALAAIRNDRFLDHLKLLAGGEVKK